MITSLLVEYTVFDDLPRASESQKLILSPFITTPNILVPAIIIPGYIHVVCMYMYLKDCVALFEYNNNFSSSYSNMIISGHWDKKIRFWDLRVSSVNPSHELAIQGRVTSLSLFPGKRRRKRRRRREES